MIEGGVLTPWLAEASLWDALRQGWATLLLNLDKLLLAPLEYPLLARSMEAAIIVGIVSGVLGTFVVVRGMAFFGDALAHAILPGVAFVYQRANGKTDNLFGAGWWRACSAHWASAT